MMLPIQSAQCELCHPQNELVIWHNTYLRVVLVADPLFAGFTRVIWHEHVAEMTELAPEQRQHLMDVVFAVEGVQRAILQPAKINLASLGNVTPHLHWHVIPRYDNDACFPLPIWALPVLFRTHLDADSSPLADSAAYSANPVDAASLERYQNALKIALWSL